MSIKTITRWSAILASIFALAIFVAWIVASMPALAVIPPELGTPITAFLTKLAVKAPSFSRVLFALVTLTGMVAALLSLVLLTRGAKLAAARYLGASLGWIAFAVAYQLIASTTAPLIAYLPTSNIALMTLDGLCFMLFAFATHAFMQFVLLYPRVTTVEEQAAFHSLNDLRELSASNDRLKKSLAWLFGSAALKSNAEKWDVRLARIVFGKQLLIFLMVCAVFAALIWRTKSFSFANIGLVDLEVGAVWFVLFQPILICYCCVVPSVVIGIKLHRVLGNAEERKKVEWIYAAVMINLVAFALMQLPILLTGIVMLAKPAWVDDFHLLAIVGWGVFFSTATAPLFFIVALGLSILYRGTLDPRLVLGKFTLWGVLGVLLTFVFVLIERAVALEVVKWFKLPPETGAIAAGAIVAASFQPIRKNAEKWSMKWVASMMPATLLAAGARQEGAVVVTDITGYTALSARDESNALVASALVQKEARQVAENHEGQFVKSTGDGALLYFHTADEAMRAISDLHAAVSKGSAALNIAGLQLHSGLHWGEFVVGRDGDIYGQTVNVASRIADWAAAGEIAVSNTLATHLEQSKVALQSSGPQQFKNVPEAIECLKYSPA